ncbi:MAG: hypothetical protein Q9N34_05720 [Aquificota bacterium]|nr:hypothetical protein [Aquificota bacterium]
MAVTDTNSDGIPDRVDISIDNPNNVQVVDNSNIPDPTDPNNAGTYDRNGNGTPDIMEDHNRNGKPDCMEDRNGNGHPDSLEDWDHNGIPEGFEDENGDNIPDHVEDHYDMNGHPE